MDKAPAPAAAPAPEYKIAEVREDGTAIIEMEDGRMFAAAGVAEGLELRKRAKVTLKHVETDKDGVPVDATVTKVL